jgi:hypothetical protein
VGRVWRIVAAVVIFWSTEVVFAVLVLVGLDELEPWAWVIPGLVIWVGGLWSAWRVGSGRWGLWRGRRGHPVLAFFVTFFVAVSVSVAFGLSLPDAGPSWAEKAIPFVTLAIWVGVFCAAWRIGSRRWGEPAFPPPPRAPAAIPAPAASSRPTCPPAAVAGNSPVRFYATRSAPVLAPDTGQPIGSLERNGEYAAVGTFGGWVLIEDGSRRQGWVPDSSIPTRVWRRIPALAPVPPSPPAPDPAVFAPCPGCGRTVNRQVGCCPYCQAVVEGGQ